MSLGPFKSQRPIKKWVKKQTEGATLRSGIMKATGAKPKMFSS